MTRIPSWLTVIIAVVLAVLGGRAISAQDKYTVQVPNCLMAEHYWDPVRWVDEEFGWRLRELRGRRRRRGRHFPIASDGSA